jgi:heme exporter protein D
MSSPYTGAYTPEDPLAGQQDQEERRSIGEILGDVSRDVSTLMRQEVELAKAELKQSSSKAGKGIGMFAGAAIAGILFLVFLSVCAWQALGQYTGYGWSALIVAVVWAIVAAVLASIGKKELDKIKGMPKTAETVSKIPDALKGHEENNR